MTDTPKPKKKPAKKKAPVKKVNGRPTKYKKEYDERAKNYCLLGAVDTELADFFGITEKTLNNWKDDHPSFLQSLTEGKHDADAKVAASLYKRANGYSVTETKIEDSDAAGSKTTTQTKHIPGSDTAAIFFLKNRQNKKWRDKQEQVISAGEGVSFNMSFSAAPVED